MAKKYLYLLLLLAFTKFNLAQAQSVEDILKNYVSAVEISNKIDSVKSVLRKGIKHDNGAKREFTHYKERPNIYQFQSIDQAGNINTICSNGKEQWLRRNDDSPMKFSETPFGKYNKDIDKVFNIHIFNTLIEHWLSKDFFELEEKDTIDSQECYVVKENRTKEVVWYYIDVENYSLVMRKTQFFTGNIETYQYFKGYKNIQGLLLPTEELTTYYSNGRLYSTQKEEYTSIELNYKMNVDCPSKNKITIKE